MNTFVFVAICCLVSSTFAWDVVPVRGDPPSIRSWPSIASFPDGLLSFGGLHDDFVTGNFTFYNDLRLFLPGRNVWIELNPEGTLPSPRMTVARAYDQGRNRYYFYGGTNYDSDFSVVNIYSDFWYYELDTNTWVEVSTTSLPGARTGAVLTIHGNTLYLFGGLDNYFEGNSDIWACDLRNHQWTEIIPSNRLATRPPAMQYSPFFWYRGELFVGSGEGDVDSGFGFMNDWWSFSLAHKTWTQLDFTNSYGVPRDYLASVFYEGNIIIYGGDTPSDAPPCCGAPYPQNPTNQTWSLDVHTLTWTQINTPAPALKRHLGDLLDGRFYVAGGWGWDNNGVGQIWNPDTLVLDLDRL